jgi:hypothetical protein
VFAVLAAGLWLFALFSHNGGHLLFPGGPNFADVLVYKGRFTLYHTATFFKPGRFSAFAYPAGAAPIYALLYATSDPVTTFLLAAALSVAVFAGTAWLLLRKVALTSLLLPLVVLSFPLVFLIQRANIELVLWMALAVALLASHRGWKVCAAVIIGVAAAVKLYPIVLLGLFLKRKQDLPAFAIGVMTAILAMGAAISFAGPSFPIAAHGFFTGVGRFQDHYAETVRSAEVAWDHCLFSPFKYWAMLRGMSLASFMTPYYLLAATYAGLLFLRVRTFPWLNRAVFLTAAMVCLPPVSFAYTLTHLMLPMVLMLVAFARQRTAVAGKLSLALLLFLMLPLNAVSAFTAKPFPAGPAQALALLLLLPLCVLQPWPSGAAD